MSALLILGVILAGCRRFDAGPTPVPTQSPTPRSTALPALPTVVPLGSEANPIQMMIFSRNSSAEDTVIAALETALTENTGLTIDVRIVERPADALAALCASPEGTTSIAVIDGLTALAAEAQGCGDLSLTIERTIGNSITSVQEITIIATGEIDSFADLDVKTFCRVGPADSETWLYPSILLQANGVDLDDIDEFVEQATAQEVAEALVSEDCSAAGISTETLAALDEDTRDALTPLSPSMDVAYGILVYPEQVGLSARTAIDNALAAIASNPQELATFQAVLSAEDARPITDDDTEALREALSAARLDLAQIGR